MMPNFTAHRSPSLPPTHPGVILRDDVLPSLRMTVTAAARQLGVSRQALHTILSERAAIRSLACTAPEPRDYNG